MPNRRKRREPRYHYDRKRVFLIELDNSLPAIMSVFAVDLILSVLVVACLRVFFQRMSV